MRNATLNTINLGLDVLLKFSFNLVLFQMREKVRKERERRTKERRTRVRRMREKKRENKCFILKPLVRGPSDSSEHMPPFPPSRTCTLLIHFSHLLSVCWPLRGYSGPPVFFT